MQTVFRRAATADLIPKLDPRGGLSNHGLRSPDVVGVVLVAVTVLFAGLAFAGGHEPRDGEGKGHPTVVGQHKAASPEANANTLFEPTSHRRFDDVEYWTKVFDDPKRDAWQQPERLMDAIGLQAGQVVADLGAGTGYFLKSLSGRVAREGRVFAVEVEPSLVEHLRERAEGEGGDNVIPVLASLDNPRLPKGSVDVVLIVDTFHHLSDRQSYFARIAESLAPGGRVVIVDWRKIDLPVGPPLDHKLARSQVVEELQQSGFTLAEHHDFLDYQYVLVFTRSLSPLG